MKRIFSKEKFIESCRKLGRDPYKLTWWKDCVGLEISEIHNRFVYGISDEWIETIYEVGDYVKLKNKRGLCWNIDGLMDKYLGAVIKIKCEFSSFSFFAENAVNPWDGDYWEFCYEDIERLATAEEVAEYENVNRVATHEQTRKDTKISVVITFDGALTTAELVGRNGKTVKIAEARCNPCDVYSRSEGARIAVERLFEKKQK